MRVTWLFRRVNESKLGGVVTGSSEFSVRGNYVKTWVEIGR